MSILPPPQKDGEITFFMAKSLPYRPRMVLVGLLLVLGLGLQVTIGFWPGLVLMVLGQLLGMNSGYSAAPRLLPDLAWERVTPDDYEKVKRRADELKAWDEDFFDATSTRGLAGLAVTAALCAGLYFYAAYTWSFPVEYVLYFGLDAAVLILPLWFIGTRSYLKKDKLVIKIEMLKEVMAALTDSSEVQVQPMLALYATDKGGKEPEDARLMIKLVGATKDFYGIQAQLSINSVQGKDYPYLYCVLIAKHGAGLLEGWEAMTVQPEPDFLTGLIGKLLGAAPGGMVYEPGEPGEVDILVARQRTSRTSGYYTSPAAALSVVKSALQLAQALVRKNGAGKV